MSINILIVDDEPDVREIISFAIDVEFSPRFDLTFFEADCVSEAKSILENNEINIVISDYRMPQRNGGELFLHLGEWSKVEPVFFLATANIFEDLPEFKYKAIGGYLSKPFREDELNDMIRSSIESFQSPSNVRKGERPQFQKIRITTLLKMNPLPFDLFLRLADDKFVKVFSKGDSYGKKDCEKYQKKGVPVLYVADRNTAAAVNYFCDELCAAHDLKNVDPKDFRKLSNESQELLHGIVTQFGMSKEAEQLVKASSLLAEKMIQASPSVEKLFSAFSPEDLRLMHERSIMIGLVSCFFSNLLGWESALTCKKLCLAAILHDLTLPNPSLAAFESVESVKNSGMLFSAEEVSAFSCHSTEAAKLLKDMIEIPADVEQIILEHHERPDGKGFPLGEDYAKISSLGAVFILGESYINFLSSRKNLSDFPKFDEFLKDRAQLFQFGAFKKFLQIIKMKLNEGEDPFKLTSV